MVLGYEHERKGWLKGRGDVSGARYVLDTVLFHEFPDTTMRYRMDMAMSHARGNVLDIGCNTGGISMFLSQKFDVTAIDFIPEAIDEAKRMQHRIRMGLVDWCHPPNFKPSVKFFVGDGTDLQFEDESFVTVIVYDVVEHIPRGKIPSLISECARVCRHDGIILLSTPIAFRGRQVEAFSSNLNHPFQYLDDIYKSLEDNRLSWQEQRVWKTDIFYLFLIIHKNSNLR